MTQYHNHYFCFYNRILWKLQKDPFGSLEKTDNNFSLLSTNVSETGTMKNTWAIHQSQNNLDDERSIIEPD